ncbi:FAD-dependent oxidoreductase [Variovorax sp. J22R115]|uniref:FAD-dependent oxidoreductase n=1 Tax=Variovorax sp. J22R115 TaxID=3053509 RepID=UPI0025762022|nr:FAD-dependent oxidoreductase [Variovorax sp. J22R115]MDM0048823.1 FAD-dependent oxidoreductase [Variovorax sp. J22R115]
MKTMIDSPIASIFEERLRTPIDATYDVIVAGGGASGLIAAVAAARTGAKTLLIEHAGCLGGTGTYAMVAQWLGFYNGETRVVGGLPLELTEMVTDLGGSDGFSRYVLAEASNKPIPLVNFPFNPEVTKIACDRLAREAGVDVRLHSRVAAPMLRDDRICGVVVEDIGGRRAFRANVVIDATGDAMVAAASGAAFEGGEEELRRRRQPCTLVFRLSNVDVARFRALPREEKRALALEGVKAGRIFWESLSFCSTPGNTDAICLMSRIPEIDALDPADLGRAESEGRGQVHSIVGFLRERVPGFGRSTLANIAAHVGVRETRRIRGRYALTEEDIVSGKRFTDAIALGAGPMDLHEAGGTGISLWMPEHPFEIPMGCLLPELTPGLIVTGRAISATRSANGGSRHMGTAMALGEASGVLAGLATAQAVEPTAVNHQAVQARLRRDSALVSLEDAKAVALAT